jgi:hypothetical protein
MLIQKLIKDRSGKAPAFMSFRDTNKAVARK